MSNAVAIAADVRALTPLDDRILSDDQLWQVVSSGNLKGLSPKQKADYYRYRCQQSGLNPATQPYAYMVLDGVEQLYARKGCADQLRTIHGVSIVSVKCTRDDDYIEFEVTVRDRQGREDFDIGVVAVGDMQGPQRANKKKVALTQAKRRATLSLCGEGILDESEVMEIPGAVMVASARVAGTQALPRIDVVEAQVRGLSPGNAALQDRDRDVDGIDAETGEITGQQALPDDDAVNGIEMITRLQAERIIALRDALGYGPKEINKLAGKAAGQTVAVDPRQLSTYQAASLIAELEAMARAEDIRVTAG